MMYWTEPRQIFLEQLATKYPAGKVTEFESLLMPGTECFSSEGFMGAKETISGIIGEDTEILRQQGVTHQQVADKLDSLLGRWGTAGFLKKRLSIPKQSALEPYQRPEDIGVKFTTKGTIVDETFQVNLFSMKNGAQSCPFEYFLEGRDSSSPARCGVGMISGFITNVKTGEEIPMNDLLPHLVGDHHFFEGRGTPHGLDPEKAIRVLEINPGVDYKAKVVRDLFWYGREPCGDEREVAEYQQLCETLLHKPDLIVPKQPPWSLAVKMIGDEDFNEYNFDYLKIHEEDEQVVVEIPELQQLLFKEAHLCFSPALRGYPLEGIGERLCVNGKFFDPMIYFFGNFNLPGYEVNPYRSAAAFRLRQTLYHVG